MAKMKKSEKEDPAPDEMESDASRISKTGTVGKRGTIVIAAALRRRFGLEEGSLIIQEEREDGILIRPAKVVPVEIYTNERKAEFLLNNAIGEKDYQSARREVKKLGLDPDAIPHMRPDSNMFKPDSS